MPSKPGHPCNHPGCRVIVLSTYCESHERERRQLHDRERGTAHQRGYNSRWTKTSKGFLKVHPLCVTCMESGYIKAATVTDHIIPHKGDMILFWQRENWQPLCKLHHDIKTAKENGGFGNGGVNDRREHKGY